MTPTHNGSFRLFRLAGIQVYLHWSWFIVPILALNMHGQAYSSKVWNVLECVTLFCIVLMHEFGHSLACRQVGGNADQIVLWPLGGVAYVSPPQRPGATLWSIVAGPLVNVLLLPILWFLAPDSAQTDVQKFLLTIFYINIGLLIFNLLPVYPLDGGQIVRSLLWFVIGRAHSLMVASIIGVVGVLGLLGLAWLEQSPWLGVMSVFILMNCWRGFSHARALGRLAKVPRQAGFACPSCRAAPLDGAFWVCGQCNQPFDTFKAGAVCPNCGAAFAVTRCVDCGSEHPISQWATS